MSNSTYWQDKLAAWLYYPVTKVFGVSMYRHMSASVNAVLFKDYENIDKWQSREKDEDGNPLELGEEYIHFLRADMIATEMTRAAVPAYNQEKNLNGAVEFKNCAELNHPLVGNQKIELKLNSSILNSMNLDSLKESSRENKKTEIDKFMIPVTALLKEIAKEMETVSDLEERARYIFNYLYFAFSRQLRGNNVLQLGALWDLLPSDTRIPDHSLWNHAGLTSAIYSSKKGMDDDNLCMNVFSITPVQDFIGKARKLRDFWSGSVILSYLSFMGISYVMKTLGPDHVVYPSLQNQFLVDEFLRQEWKASKLDEGLTEKNDVLNKLNKLSSGIAAFPNKFVFICNSEDSEKLNEEIRIYIQKEWLKLTDIVKAYIAEKQDFVKVAEKYENSAQISAICEEAGKQGSAFCAIWDNTVETFWKFSWAATKFVDISEDGKAAVGRLLTEKKYKSELETLEIFKNTKNLDATHLKAGLFENAKMYGATHSLVQGLLAAGKTKPNMLKNSEQGEKCPLCGEHQVLHNFVTTGAFGAAEYNKATQAFWTTLGDAVDHNKNKAEKDKEHIQIGKKERLCAVCATKRLLPLALEKYKSHLLYKTLADGVESFPSTTEMALWEVNKDKSESEQKKLAQKYHKNEVSSEESIDGSRTDKYYAFLLMDGDKMGDLVNGDSIEATWKDVLSSELVKRFEDKQFCPDSPFRKDCMNRKRSINPALHAMISDSLNNFARYGVQPAFYDEKGREVGRLIYAGGDDVCAILPLSEAFRVADSIRRTYTYSFAGINSETGELEEIKDSHSDFTKYSKIGMHLGSGAEKISISGAIIIAHHKQPLREVIMTAHSVLDGVAKTKSGRNSIAIRFMARSGGDRDVWFKWDEKGLYGHKVRHAFEYVVESAKSKELSTSLLYNIENLRGLIEPLSDLSEVHKTQIKKLFEYEVSHSRGNSNDSKKLAEALATICIPYSKSEEHKTDWFNPDAAVVANFIAKADGKTSDEVNEYEEGNE